MPHPPEYISSWTDRGNRNLGPTHRAVRNEVDFDSIYISHLSHQLKFHCCTASSSTEYSDERMKINENQYLCNWESKERIYCITIHIHKSVQKADFAQNLLVIPGCEEALSISFSDIEQVRELGPTIEGFVLMMKSQNPSSIPCTIMNKRSA